MNQKKDRALKGQDKLTRKIAANQNMDLGSQPAFYLHLTGRMLPSGGRMGKKSADQCRRGAVKAMGFAGW